VGTIGTVELQAKCNSVTMLCSFCLFFPLMASDLDSLKFFVQRGEAREILHISVQRRGDRGNNKDLQL
jgi:hypothetical protein